MKPWRLKTATANRQGFRGTRLGATNIAEKRMFSKTIIDSDAFLEMPLSTQALYFHLNMRADDDGFINNPKKIQRMVGCADDDFKILLAKRFIMAFESGVIVIKHWRLHNCIRRDTYKETLYIEEKSSLYVKPDGAYTDHPLEALPAPVTPPLQFRDEDVTQIRIDKDREDNISPQGNFELFWKTYPKKVGKEAARKAFKKVKVNINALLSAVEDQKRCEQWLKDGGQYIPNPATWLNQGRWEDEPLTKLGQALQTEKKQKQYRPVVVNGETIMEEVD